MTRFNEKIAIESMLKLKLNIGKKLKTSIITKMDKINKQQLKMKIIKILHRL